ncbi:sodium:solute symporter family protein [Carboxylicivirga sediminis]|uniref:Sodium:solute symporter family protein n=1 Tax=Carboxylicivirga sediminis TaxID=2006564 RepID=A0A941F3D0_9BACT|nr:sodium:solute symporter family protein [Carboxylicivirga sediminis]MBR8535569.1 sodium:solute symporter family protein [Carboxylicivirga sediminis]
MHTIDLIIFFVYLIAMLGVGFFFMRRNKTPDDYYVGGRKLKAGHIGLSVVATDVGGGFSIGLGGLGFLMGLSGSWLLFSGLVGAWLSAVILIPKVSRLARERNFLTFPQFLEHAFNKKVALFAGIITAIGYIGFTSSQILAGAKLASSTFPALSMDTALLVMGTIAIVYTAIGGLKAVIYTDTVQWIVLMGGLLFVALPFAYFKIGGIEIITSTLKPDFLSLTAISWSQIVNWLFTIVPIWFIGMTLYQRIYAAKDTKTAQRGWLIAGLFEYPLMAFLGVTLGMFARVAFESGIITNYAIADIDAEMGLPILLRTILPAGLMGIVLSAYFSAIMSTADSCLMAASGNILTDVFKLHNKRHNLRYSQLITLLIGILALFIALKVTSVLDLMLHSYSFMVSGMFIPVVAALSARKPNPEAALAAMLIGGGTTLILIIFDIKLAFGLDANIAGIAASGITYLIENFISRLQKNDSIIPNN